MNRRCWLLITLWMCFVLRGVFYASLFPLWEGYDEFAHFGVVRAIAVQGKVLVPRDQAGPRDVEESLRLLPIPWEVRDWPVFRKLGSSTHDDYNRLPAEERRRREERVRTLPAEWSREESTQGISAYEALQPPLAYWLMSPALAAVRSTSLPTQVMTLRWFGVALASLAIPLIFAIALRATGSERTAIGCTAVAVVMPELAATLGRVSNEPLAILLFTWMTWAGLRALDRDSGVRTWAELGVALGLGLLTKAYFLTAVPVVAAFLVWNRLRPFGWTTPLATATISGLVVRAQPAHHRNPRWTR